MFSFSCAQSVIAHLNILINIHTRAHYKVPVNFHIKNKHFHLFQAVSQTFKLLIKNKPKTRNILYVLNTYKIHWFYCWKKSKSKLRCKVPTQVFLLTKMSCFSLKQGHYKCSDCSVFSFLPFQQLWQTW